MQFMRHALRTGGFCLASILFLVIGSLRAQGPDQRSNTSPHENSVGRLLFGNYSTPAIRSFDLPGDKTLDSMVKDGKIELTDEDAIRLALENNVDINVERYSPYFSLWGIDKGKAVLEPTVSFNSNLNRLVTPASSLLQGVDTLFSLTTTTDLNVHKPYEAGLDVDIDFRTARGRNNSFFTSLNPSIAPTLSLTLTQHLLRDFGKITRSRVIRIARNGYRISEQNFATRVSDIITSVLNTYWDLVYADDNIKVTEDSLKLAQIVLDQNKIQAEVGTMAPLDVIQAEAEVASRNQQLVVARYTRKITEDQLKKLISSRPDPGLITATLVPTTKPTNPPPPSVDAAQAIQRALEERSEIRGQQLDQENKQIQIDYTRNQLKPMLDFSASYSQNGLGGDTIIRDTSSSFFNAPIIGIQPGGFADSLSSLFSRKYLGYVVGFNFLVPIGNSSARADNAQARVDYRQGEERLRSQRQQIALQVRQAYDQMELGRANVEAAAVTIRYQEQRLQGEQDKYSLGATTTRSVIEAQRDLETAQGVLLQARTGLIKSRIALDRAIGDTLSVHNIEIDDVLGLKK